MAMTYVAAVELSPEAFVPVATGLEQALSGRMSAARVQSVLAGLTLPRGRAFRVNLLKNTVEALSAELTAAAVPFTAHRLAAGAFTTDAAGEYRLKSTAAFKEGRLYCQSLASQLPAWLGEVRPGMRILDACAAPGGKTTLLAMRLAMAEGFSPRASGQVTALERAAVRAQQLAHTVKLQGATSRVRCHTVDSRSPGRAVESIAFDHALVDVPCSGSGRIRQQESRSWAHLVQDYHGYVDSRARMQASILGAVASRLRPGATLVYSTCSLDPRENEAVLSGLLAEQPRWRVEDLSSWHDRLAGAGPGLSGEGLDPRCAGALRIDPTAESEGFFAALLTAG
jgi:16S rRNA C967 or C1407 C5-methylase (RsmB/RsmF family)